jgi:hypothetical protein
MAVLSHQESDGTVLLERCLGAKDMDRTRVLTVNVPLKSESRTKFAWKWFHCLIFGIELIDSSHLRVMKDTVIQCNDIMSRLDAQYAVFRTDVCFDGISFLPCVGWAVW